MGDALLDAHVMKCMSYKGAAPRFVPQYVLWIAKYGRVVIVFVRPRAHVTSSIPSHPYPPTYLLTYVLDWMAPHCRLTEPPPCRCIYPRVYSPRGRAHAPATSAWTCVCGSGSRGGGWGPTTRGCCSSRYRSQTMLAATATPPGDLPITGMGCRVASGKENRCKNTCP